jgi:hypothetical protein
MEEEQENSVSDKASEESNVSTLPSSESTTEVTKEEFVYFIRDKAEKYFPKFRRFNVDGVDKFAVTWHWPACFFSYTWMAYRKMYKWALATFVLQYLFYQVYFRLLDSMASLLNPYLGSVLPVLMFPPLIILGIVFPFAVFGITGNYLYYKYVKGKIIECKAKLQSSDAKGIAIALHKTGGVNPWAAILTIVITILISQPF